MSTEKPAILIVDDEASLQYAFRQFFEEGGWHVLAATTGRKALKQLSENDVDCVFLDVRLPDCDGISLLPRMRNIDPEVPVVMMTAYGSLETAVRAMDSGIIEYFVKPVDLDRALEVAQTCLPQTTCPDWAKEADAAVHDRQTEFIGASRPMQQVFRQIGIFASSDATVLVTGETGTGKEMVARAIHFCGPRKNGPFVPVNCGALPDQLVESELFGYQKGAFTGADDNHAGRVEAAADGTLFLDEVGELPLSAQVKLLRFLDTHNVERLGSVKPHPVDVRIVAATNRDLTVAIREGHFREDLYYRLAVMRILLPPLRERSEDISLLADHFLRTLSDQSPCVLGQAAMKILQDHTWPGNVRELRNVIQHAAILARGGVILPNHLPLETFSRVPAVQSEDREPAMILKQYIDSLAPQPGKLMDQAVAPLEQELIRQALEKFHGNRSAAAEYLGIHRNTLRNKMAYIARMSS